MRQTAKSLSFSSDLVRLAHARAQAVNGEAARLEVRGYTSGASSHARGHFRVSRLTFEELRKKKRLFVVWTGEVMREFLFSISCKFYDQRKNTAILQSTDILFSSVQCMEIIMTWSCQFYFCSLDYFNYSNKSMQELGEQLHDYTCYTSIIN